MICALCKKQRLVANRISHSNIKTKRRQYANVQRVHAILDGKVRRIHVCTRCLRSGKIVKAG